MNFFNVIAASSIRGVTTIVTPPSSDVGAPSVPINLTEGYTDSNSTFFTWRAQTDQETLIVNYKVYKNNVFEKDVWNNEAKILGLTQGNYSFTVSSVDASGNESAKSQALVIAIPAAVADPLDALIASKGQLALDRTYIDLSSANVREENNTLYLTKWVDRSPNLNYAVQTDLDLQMEILPEYKSVLPDGFDDVMILNTDMVLDAATGGFSIYICIDRFSSGLSIVLGRRIQTVGSGANVYFFKNGANYEMRFVTASAYLMTFGGLVKDDIVGNKIYEVHHDGVGNATLLINGVSKSTITVNNDSWNIGRLNSPYDGDYFEGLYKGIFSFNTILSASEKTLVRDSLTARYNIT